MSCSEIIFAIGSRAVTDMLIAILNCCTKEELEEEDEEEETPMAITPETPEEPESRSLQVVHRR